VDTLVRISRGIKIHINVLSTTVVYPNRFLEAEDVANNFLFNTDRYGLRHRRTILSTDDDLIADCSHCRSIISLAPYM